MNTAQGIDAKTDRFTQYLDRSEAVDRIAKALVALYEEPQKPDNPIQFIKQFLGAAAVADVAKLQWEVEQLKEKNDGLERRVDEMKLELETAKKSKKATPARRGKK